MTIRRYFVRAATGFAAAALMTLPPTGAPAQPAAAGADDAALYTRCSFYPQAHDCAAAYRRALTDTSPQAAAVRDAVRYYARYLADASGGLTAADRQYLARNGIALPQGLNAQDQAGLHNVINDPQLISPQARSAAVNNFLGRAVQAELYCRFNSCGGPAVS